MSEEERRLQARRLAEERYGFWWHLGVYVFVNAGLVGIWFFTSASRGDFFWPVFPLFFWGIFVVGHYLSAYRRVGGTWIQRETEKILHEEEGQHP